MYRRLCPHCNQVVTPISPHRCQPPRLNYYLRLPAVDYYAVWENPLREVFSRLAVGVDPSECRQYTLQQQKNVWRYFPPIVELLKSYNICSPEIIRWILSPNNISHLSCINEMLKTLSVDRKFSEQGVKIFLMLSQKETAYDYYCKNRQAIKIGTFNYYSNIEISSIAQFFMKVINDEKTVRLVIAVSRLGGDQVCEILKMAIFTESFFKKIKKLLAQEVLGKKILLLAIIDSTINSLERIYKALAVGAEKFFCFQNFATVATVLQEPTSEKPQNLQTYQPGNQIKDRQRFIFNEEFNEIIKVVENAKKQMDDFFLANPEFKTNDNYVRIAEVSQNVVGAYQLNFLADRYKQAPIYNRLILLNKCHNFPEGRRPRNFNLAVDTALQIIQKAELAGVIVEEQLALKITRALLILCPYSSYEKIKRRFLNIFFDNTIKYFGVKIRLVDDLCEAIFKVNEYCPESYDIPSKHYFYDLLFFNIFYADVLVTTLLAAAHSTLKFLDAQFKKKLKAAGMSLYRDSGIQSIFAPQFEETDEFLKKQRSTFLDLLQNIFPHLEKEIAPSIDRGAVVTSISNLPPPSASFPYASPHVAFPVGSKKPKIKTRPAQASLDGGEEKSLESKEDSAIKTSGHEIEWLILDNREQEAGVLFEHENYECIYNSITKTANNNIYRLSAPHWPADFNKWFAAIEFNETVLDNNMELFSAIYRVISCGVIIAQAKGKQGLKIVSREEYDKLDEALKYYLSWQDPKEDVHIIKAKILGRHGHGAVRCYARGVANDKGDLLFVFRDGGVRFSH